MSNHARPIDEVVRDERTPPRIRKLLAEIGPIKKYGEKHGLKPTQNYTEYVKLDRPAAVWVVSAAEPLKLRSREWGFPIIGRVPYLGWFDLEAARRFGKELESGGWDVDIRGAGAYSTLGWFRDAVLSTMISDGDEALGELVDVVLHESVHATVYLGGQAYFNESLATFVAGVLTRSYLESVYGKDSALERAYLDAEAEGEVRRKRLHDAYGELDALYSSGKSDEQKRREKDRILSQLKSELKFKRALNNATLIQYKAYSSGFPEFEAVFKACRGDWARFWRVIGQLSSSSFKESQQENIGPVLLPLTASCR